MRSMAMIVLAALLTVGCEETDAPGAENGVEPVDMDTVAWLNEGRTVEFNDRSWILTGEPVYDPTVEHVGEFEGTPLYANLGVTPPYSALYIPLDMDYWQRLEPVGASPMPETDTGVSEIR